MPRATLAFLSVLTLVGCPETAPPEVVCSTPAATVSPGSTAQFTVEASGGPDDLTYSWVLAESPEGSAAVLLDRDETTSTLLTDLVGSYTADVTVTGKGEASAVCSASVTATDTDTDTDTDSDTDTDTDGPTDVPEGLFVEVVWSLENDDVDLHLLRGDAPFQDPFGDCSYQNPNPDWGEAQNTADNPTISADSGVLGPETIHIPQPEAGMTYVVVVHDYGDPFVPDEPIDPSGTNEVTVTAWLDTEQVFQETRRMTGEDSHDDFALLDPTAGIATPR